jgi:hypothetical protein
MKRRLPRSNGYGVPRQKRRQANRLDVLATLIDAYEAVHYPIDPPDPVEAIKFRMEQQGLAPVTSPSSIGTSVQRMLHCAKMRRHGVRRHFPAAPPSLVKWLFYSVS